MRAQQQSTLDLPDREKAPIPYEQAAFWERLSFWIKDSCSEVDTDEKRIEWLVENLRTDKNAPVVTRETVERWAGKRSPCRPTLPNIQWILAALNKVRCPKGKGELKREDLLAGLPKYKGAPRGVHAHTRKDRPRENVRPGVPASTGPEPASGDGVSDSEERTSEQGLAALRAEVVAILARSPELVQALTELKYSSQDAASAQDVARRLCSTHARQAASDLAKLANRVVKGAYRQQLPDLLYCLLPLVVDWVEILPKVSDTEVEGNDLELPLKTETVTEIFLARDERRRCFFAPGDLEPQGISHMGAAPLGRCDFNYLTLRSWGFALASVDGTLPSA